MSNIVYLTVTGEQQGSISAGCGTSESTGNRWQSGHEDEIFTFSLLNSITNTGLGSQFHGITFCKLIDKTILNLQLLRLYECKFRVYSIFTLIG